MSLVKQAEMVKKLAELTDSGVVDWKQSVSKEAFQVSLRDNTVRVTTSSNQGEQDIVVQLLNSSGELVESFTDVDLTNSEEQTGSNKNWFGLMRDLFENARRKALGADKVLDEIIADLDSTALLQ